MPKFLDSFIPIETRASPEGKFKAKVLLVATFYFSAVMLSGVLGIFIFFPEISVKVLPILIYGTIMAVGCLSSPWILRRTRSLFISALPVLLAYLTVPLVGGLYNGGLSAPSVSLIILFPILWQFFVTNKFGTYGFLACLFVLFFLKYAQVKGWTNPSVLQDPAMRTNLQLLILSGTCLFSSLVAIAYAKNRKTSERHLMQLSRSASVGLISGGFVHEVNSPLAAIFLSSESLLLMAEKGSIDPAEVRKIANRIDRSTKKIAMITKTILANALEDKLDTFQHCNIKQIIDQSLALCEEKISEAKIDFQMEPNLTNIFFDCRPTQMAQAIFNLIYNSIEATAHLNIKWIRISAKENSDSIEISIKDSGEGIQNEIQSKLFTAFFTTKDVGLGFGLGLANSASIVMLHHGQIFYDSKNKNTCFVIRLPKVQQKAHPFAPSSLPEIRA